MADRISVIVAEAVKAGLCDLDEAMGIIASVHTARQEVDTEDFRHMWGSVGIMVVCDLSRELPVKGGK